MNLRLRFSPKEAPLHEEPGWSHYALRASKTWDAKDRPPKYRGNIYGLVVHTTGAGLPAKARARGLYHTVQAVDYYSKSHGCHYVCGWRGLDGDLLQVAHEDERANGVGMKDQVASVRAGRFAKDLPKALVSRWRRRWAPLLNPLQLFAGTSANSCYVHVEMPPCVYHDGEKLRTDAGPFTEHARFTEAQHDAIAFLACDLARRYKWPDGWWTTGRLVGHEDLSPITRHTSHGGWDPGALRFRPWFDWAYVYEVINEIQGDDDVPA